MSETGCRACSEAIAGMSPMAVHTCRGAGQPDGAPSEPTRPTWIVDLRYESLPVVRRRDSPPVVIRGFANATYAEEAAKRLNTLYAALRVPVARKESE